jgi:acetyltransferase-like isoleucine patch superfamily enzyme
VLRRLARVAFDQAKARESTAMTALYRFRRAKVILRMRVAAKWRGSVVQVDIAPDVRFARQIGIHVQGGTKNVVRIREGSTIGDRVLFLLKGGTILFGERTEIRRDTVLNVSGRLELEGENIISWANLIHCADSVRFGRLSSTNEWVTIVDSSHYFTEPDAFFHHNVKTGPIDIGYNSWICSKATVARNASVGDHCIIAGNSVVTGAIPSGHLASGVPAQIVRPLPHPWTSTAAEMAEAAGT